MSRKLFITLILILFLLPFVSWYYLQSGLNWRRQAQELMKGTQAFPAGEWIDSRGLPFSNSDLDPHVTLITRIDCDSAKQLLSTISQFYDQFKESKKSSYIILNECNSDSSWMSDSTKKNWHVYSCFDSTGLCRVLLKDWPAGKSHALMDKNQILRSYYTSGSKDEKRVLLEHMALLLPRDRSEKVELKRGNRK